jgi:hypothetical protein
MADWLIFPTFLLVWAAASVGIARLGWTALATRYRAWDLYDGDKWSFQSAQVGRSTYRSCLTIGVTPPGLHLSVLFPFRLCHPPLLIPWGDITTTETQWSFGRGYVLRFKQVPEVTIALSGGLGDRLQLRVSSNDQRLGQVSSLKGASNRGHP